MKKQFRILAAALALCLSLLCCPAAFAAVDSSSCQDGTLCAGNVSAAGTAYHYYRYAQLQCGYQQRYCIYFWL